MIADDSQRCGRPTRAGAPCRVVLRAGRCATHDSDLAARNAKVRASFAQRDPQAYAAHQRRAGVKWGPDNPHWKGDAISGGAGRARARRRFPAKACVRCGATEQLHRHHKDGDPRNNALANIEILCQPCHAAAHGGRFAWFHEAEQETL